MSFFPNVDSVSGSEDPNIVRINEVFVAIADLVVEAAADAATGSSAVRIGHLMAGELGDRLDSTEAEGFVTLAGRRPEGRGLAKVTRTTSLSTLEPSSKGSNPTADEGPPDTYEERVDEGWGG